jgi:hypothetical protein
MDENWYAAEQEIRDRISQARAAARVRTLVRELATPPPRRDSIAAVLRRWATWIVEASPTGRRDEVPQHHDSRKDMHREPRDHPVSG